MVSVVVRTEERPVVSKEEVSVSLVVAVVSPGEENDSVVLGLIGMLDTGQEVCVTVPEVAVVAVPWQ